MIQTVNKGRNPTREHGLSLNVLNSSGEEALRHARKGERSANGVLLLA